MESSHFLAISSPCGTLQKVVLRFWICCHGNEIWAIFQKNWNCFFFVSRWNRAIYWPLVLHEALYKTLFLDFSFRPPNALNLLPKICNCTKSPISRLVWQIDRRCLGLLGGFRGWPIKWNYAKCCGADRRCHGNDIWPRRGDLVAYRLVCLSLCACLCMSTEMNIKKLWTKVHDIFWKDGAWPKRNRLDFVGGLYSFLHYLSRFLNISINWHFAVYRSNLSTEFNKTYMEYCQYSTE